MKRDELLALADRVEALTEPDREIDDAIWAIVKFANYATVPAFTDSLDAAITLVPEGRHTKLALEDRHSHSWHWTLRGGYGVDSSARAATPALAFCAAALRAIAAQGGE